MAGTQASSGPIPLVQVLEEEYQCLHGEPAVEAAVGRSEDDRLSDVLRRFQTRGHSALCLSGGGVRSASFALGILQGLSHIGGLGAFDYLSTVSGGGYAGGWLSAWRLRAHHHGEPDAIRQLGTPRPGRPPHEPQSLSRLRRYIRFLDPRVGALAVDVWTLGATIARNLLLNWLVLVPLLAAAALVPRVYLGVVALPMEPAVANASTLATWYTWDWIVISGLFVLAATYAALELPSLGNRGHAQTGFLIWFLVPVLLGELLLSVHWAWTPHFASEPTPLPVAIVFSMVGMMAPWLIGSFLSRRWWRPWTWLAAAISGGVGRAIAWTVRSDIMTLAGTDPTLYGAIDLPITLGCLILQTALFVGLSSREMDDQDREWWARVNAWLLIALVAWLGASAIIFLGPRLLARLSDGLQVSPRVTRAIMGLVSLLAGGTASHLGTSVSTSPAKRRSSLSRFAFLAAAPAIATLLLLLLASADLGLLELADKLPFVNVPPHPIGAGLVEDLLVGALLLALGYGLGQLVSVNQFSLHGMYRARLVRTFLGASRRPEERRPNQFTGFDNHDDVRMAALRTLGPPFHVVNTTLNLVASNQLAVQERKSEAFTMSALHAGAPHTGYRPSDAYAGGFSLGQAMTISGAAVSPNMGAASSPVLTFLLTLFNARLGAWLGNPGPAGVRTWQRHSPGWGAAPLLSEMFGRTSDTNPYVYLSDGGHFENLGLYEMVRRRCRHIVVSDAGCDPDYCFNDLANAIRKIRLDFGVDIELPEPIAIGALDGTAKRAHYVVGVIRYSALDPSATDGSLLYIKASLTGDEPIDVANYARTHPLFPHESTADQWFDDAQFESYRMLGAHSVQSLCDRAVDSISGLCERASSRMNGERIER